jgi:hypothetical protein
MTQPQHYRVSLAKAIAHYQQGDLTAKGLLHFYLKIRIAPGWIMKKTAKEICDELGIGKTAFYSALSKLKAEGSINWSTPPNTQFSISLPFRECGNDSVNAESQFAIAESDSVNAENDSVNAESQFAIAENKSPEVPTGKVFSNSPYSSSNLLSNSSFKSLSDERERNFLEFKSGLIPEEFESFWDFAMYVAKSFKPTLTTEAIRLPEAWIKKYHQELYNQFLDGLEQKYGSRNFAEILSWEKSSGNSPIVENQAEHSPSAAVMGQCKCSQCSPVEEEAIW